MRKPRTRAGWGILAGAVFLYLAIAFYSAFTEQAWVDEAWYGAPARELALHGRIGTPNFFGEGLPRVEKHTYWIMPGFIVVLAGWMKVVGTGLLAARFLNVMLAVAALFLWMRFLELLGWDSRVAALAAALLAIDTFFVTDAIWVRADMLALVLLMSSFVSYLSLRERNLPAALLASFSCAVATGLTHPNAGILSVAGVLVLLWRDRARLRYRHLWCVALPFAAGALLWGAYISVDPAAFIGQMGHNSAGRFRPILAPLRALHDEAVYRYAQAFGLRAHNAGTPAAVWLKSLVLATYWGSAAAAIAAALVESTRREVRIPVLIFAAFLCFYTFFDATRTTYYLIWIVPFYCTFFAWLAVKGWQRRGVGRVAAIAALAAVFALESGATIMRARRQPRLRSLDTVADYLRKSAGTGPATFASSEMGFFLGFDGRQYTDDETFGSISGIRPRFIVVSSRYEGEVLQNPHPKYPMARDFVRANCRVVFDREGYRVYRCK